MKLNSRVWVMWRLSWKMGDSSWQAELSFDGHTAVWGCHALGQGRELCIYRSAHRLFLVCLRLQTHVLPCPEFESSFRDTAIENRDHCTRWITTALLFSQACRGEGCFPSWHPSMVQLTSLMEGVFPGCKMWDLFSFSSLFLRQGLPGYGRLRAFPYWHIIYSGVAVAQEVAWVIW